ncbi:MAG: hypothetical protein JO079_12760, partial [Frankiaceae bacterium]|nr:hypothetical protein [Frankiaceae bacterium]
MIAAARSITLAAAALTLAACQGGGATAPPFSTGRPAPSAPSSNNRAQASITIHYAQNVHRLATHSGRRSPRFVDPNGNVLQISSTTSANGNSTFSIVTVNAGADGTQTVNFPIVASPGAGNTTFINVVETGGEGGSTLATGQASLTNVMPGTSVSAPPITLYMNTAGIAITTDLVAASDATALSANAASPTPWTPCTSSVSYVYPFDGLNNLVLAQQNVGVGGIPTPQLVSQTSDNGGTSRIATDTFNGIHVVFDAHGDGVVGHFQTFDINPADNNPTLVTA